MMRLPSVLGLGIAAVVLTGVLGYNLIHKPTQAFLHRIWADRAQETQSQERQASVAGLLDEIERLRSRLAPEPDASWLVREVMTWSREAGIRLTTITPQAPRPLQQLTHLSVEFEFTASYHELGAFLDLLEQSETFLRVDALEVDQAPSAAGPAPVRLVISTLYAAPVRAAQPG